MKKKPECLGFPPSIDNKCTTIILGSMPGVTSLAARQYYAHPQNRFWRLMFRLLDDTSEVPADYQARLSLLLRHHIALWDSIDSCDRQGSLDSDIKNETGSDISSLLDAYPNIRTICLNGAKSFQAFRKYNRSLLDRPQLVIHPLPSTSPANARWSFDRLLPVWQKALKENI